MTKAERTIAIETNRTALLRIVQCWLLFAALFRAKRDRVLPRRIGLWVSSQIFKAELAAFYLRVASGHVPLEDASRPVEDYDPLTIHEAVLRLKAVKRTLVRLKPAVTGFAQCQQHFARFSWKHHALDTTRHQRRNTLLPWRATFSCRAPPSYPAFQFGFSNLPFTRCGDVNVRLNAN